MIKPFVFYLVLLFLPLNSLGQLSVVPTAEVLTNTFSMQTDTLRGTCFLIVENGNEYIVTARHLFKMGIRNGDSLSFQIGRGAEEKGKEILEYLRGEIYLHDTKDIDIVVVKTSNKLGHVKPYECSASGATLGQDCYFLGFPYAEKYSTTINGEVGRYPFIKKATFSANYTINNINLYLLDGLNNPSFSGGPVIFYDYNSNKNKILGVITAYHLQLDQAKIEDQILYYTENSGIGICYPTHYILDIIRKIK